MSVTPLLTVLCPDGMTLNVYEDGSLRVINSKDLDVTPALEGCSPSIGWMQGLARKLAEVERERALLLANFEKAAAVCDVLALRNGEGR